MHIVRTMKSCTRDELVDKAFFLSMRNFSMTFILALMTSGGGGPGDESVSVVPYEHMRTSNKDDSRGGSGAALRARIVHIKAKNGM